LSLCCLFFFFWTLCYLSFLFWTLCCLSFFELRILIISLVSPNTPRNGTSPSQSKMWKVLYTSSFNQLCQGSASFAHWVRELTSETKVAGLSLDCIIRHVFTLTKGMIFIATIACFFPVDFRSLLVVCVGYFLC
jgi:hypothetical protein